MTHFKAYLQWLSGFGYATRIVKACSGSGDAPGFETKTVRKPLSFVAVSMSFDSVMQAAFRVASNFTTSVAFRFMARHSTPAQLACFLLAIDLCSRVVRSRNKTRASLSFRSAQLRGPAARHNSHARTVNLRWMKQKKH